ncbi:MAG: T9SS type A sorting domain-containing protein, partial [Segetibacter sp.]|nr:T9SS type A sorting domain-containing protein [Segetibacter sp.]
LSGTSTITVFNAFGQQKARLITGANSEKINIASWPEGVYIVQVVSNGKAIVSERIVKQE